MKKSDILGIAIVLGALSLVGVILYSPNVLNLGAPRTAIFTNPTSTAPAFSFAIATTSTAYEDGTTTLAVYGSTTIQTPEDTERAFDIRNSASSSVFRVDTVNSSTTAAGTFNTGTLNAGDIFVASCAGCSTNIAFPGETWAFIDDTIDFLRAGTSTLLGIGVYGSSTIQSLATADYLTASGTLTVDGSTFLNASTTLAGDFTLSGSLLAGQATTSTLWVQDLSQTPCDVKANLGAFLCGEDANGAGESWTFVDDTVDFLRAGTSSTMGIWANSSSTFDGGLLVRGALTASSTLTIDDTFILESTGVSISADGDGAVTFLGLSAGSDEDLTINLDDFTNAVVFTSSTGVTDLRFNSLGLIVTASSTIQALQVQDVLSASSTLIVNGLSILSGGFLSNASSSVQEDFTINYGTAPAVTLNAEIGIDSTQGQFLYGVDSATVALASTSQMSFIIGSTTRSASANGAGFAVATGTWQIARWAFAATLNELYCDLDNNQSTTTVEIGDGVNTTTPTSISGVDSFPNSRALTTNNTFTEGERMYFSAGSAVGTPHELSCTIKYVNTRQ